MQKESGKQAEAAKKELDKAAKAADARAAEVEKKAAALQAREEALAAREAACKVGVTVAGLLCNFGLVQARVQAQLGVARNSWWVDRQLRCRFCGCVLC